MKKFIVIALVLVLTVCALTGCRSRKQEPTTVPTTAAPTTRPTTAPTTAPTTMPTTMPTEPSTDMTGPDMETLIPGGEDTVDPTSGANQDTRIGGMH